MAENTTVVCHDTWGPSPIPPWVISLAVPDSPRGRLRECLLQMDEDEQGRRILARGRFSKFIAGVDRDYDPIRPMAREAARVALHREETVPL